MGSNNLFKQRDIDHIAEQRRVEQRENQDDQGDADAKRRQPDQRGLRALELRIESFHAKRPPLLDSSNSGTSQRAGWQAGPFGGCIEMAPKRMVASQAEP